MVSTPRNGLLGTDIATDQTKPLNTEVLKPFKPDQTKRPKSSNADPWAQKLMNRIGGLS
jgi:hypothetical protein